MHTKKDYIKIQRGLDIPLQGAAAESISDARNIRTYALLPDDFVGVAPKLLVAQGDTVTAGTALFSDKNDPRILFPSPVNGVIRQIVRGEKRRLVAVVVEREDVPPATHSPLQHSSTLESPHLRERLLAEGLWPLLRQRPFGTVARPDSQPKGIFISCFDTAPLAPKLELLLKGREEAFLAGLQLLAHLAPAPIHLSFGCEESPIERTVRRHLVTPLSPFHIHHFSGPHPAGNVGTHIAYIDPINKGDVVWILGPQEVAILGHWALTGEYRPDRCVAFAGPDAKQPHYYRITSGACVAQLVDQQRFNPLYPALDDHPSVAADSSIRYISGNVLSGTTLAPDGFVHFYDSLITALAEGHYYDFMGWLLPGFRKYSFSRTFISGMLQPLFTKLQPLFKSLLPLCEATPPLCDKLLFDTNRHGDVRPFVLTGQFERLMPLDIYPLQLIKAAIIGDIDLMEQLGIYEVEPEDFALCEFADASKTEIQTIIRTALEQCRKEAL